MTAQRHTDQQIIDAFRAGGRAREWAWEFAYKDWRNRAVGAIVKQGGKPDEALEAIHEIHSTFEQRVRRTDFELRDKLSSYFVTCALRHWVRTKRGEKMKILELESVHLTEFADSLEDQIAQADLAKVLDDSMTRLGERCKKILLLFINGYNMKEIAEKMGFAGGEQVAKNEKRKCQERYEDFLRKHPAILKRIQDLING